MEKLKLDLIQLNKALKTLENSFNVQRKAVKMDDQEFILATEDSIIQRFEYTYEVFWKFLKKYLEVKHHLEDIHSSRRVFYASVKAQLCTLEEGDVFIVMAEARNATSHTYSIEGSRDILPGISRYYAAMYAVVERFNKEFVQ